MKVYAVDWDGCVAVEAWPGLGEWLPGATEALLRLCEKGTVLIHTCRVAPVEPDGVTWRDPDHVGREIRAIRKKLNLAGLHQVQIWTKPWKPRANYYVDDRALKFDGDWAAILEEVA